MSLEHVVTRINDGWYVCDVCGQTGSERWADLHQFPSRYTPSGLDEFAPDTSHNPEVSR